MSPELVLGALGGILGSAFWHGLVLLFRRKRYVVRTREFVVESPDVIEIPDDPQAIKSMWATPPLGGALRGDPGQIVLSPTPRRKFRKLSNREKALRALRGDP